MAASPPTRAPITALIDWAGDGFAVGAHDDVSRSIVGGADEELIRLHQPISLIEGSAGPAQLTMRLANPDGKFTPGNSSSPIAAYLVPGKRVRVEATPIAGAVRGVFDGHIRHITPHGGPRGERYATITAEDALFRASRRRVSAAPSTARSLLSWRTDIATSLGFALSTQRNIETSSPEADQPVTYADERNMLDLLNEIARVTGSIHYVHASDDRAIGAVYRSRGRLPTWYGNASVATYTAADIESSDGFDLGDSSIANRAAFTAEIVSPAQDVELYALDAVTLGANQTRIMWAHFAWPAFSIASTYIASGVTVTITLLSGGGGARIELVAGAGGGTVNELLITGTVAVAESIGSEARPGTVTAEFEPITLTDAASVAAFGEWEAPRYSSGLYASPAAMSGRMQHLIDRYSSGLPRPVVRIFGKMPDVFTRLPGDRIIISNGELGISAMPLIIGSRTLTMSAGGFWRAEWACEKAPATKTLFTIGGSAAQGVGGTGVLED